MQDQANAETQEPVHDGSKESIDGKPLGYFTQLIHALGSLHPHDNHQNGKEAAEQRVEEAFIHRLWFGEDAKSYAKEHGRDSRTLQALFDDWPDLNFFRCVAGLLTDIKAGHHDRGNEGRDVHEGVEGCRPGLVGHFGGIQLGQHSCQSRTTHGTEQPTRGNSVGNADAWKFPQGVTANQYNNNANPYSSESWENDFGEVLIADCDTSGQSNLHQQEADEFVD